MVKHINKKQITKVALDENFETLVIYCATLELLTAMPIYPSRTSQVQGLDKFTLTALLWDKALTKISAKCLNYFEVFLINLAIELLKNTNINKYAIKIIKKK